MEERHPDDDRHTTPVSLTPVSVTNYEELRPRLYAITRSETEGKSVTKHVVAIVIKNWHFRVEEAKVLSVCLERHERLESIQFIRSRFSRAALDLLTLPNSGMYTTLHILHMIRVLNSKLDNV